jgi:hypothetical protein
MTMPDNRDLTSPKMKSECWIFTCLIAIAIRLVSRHLSSHGLDTLFCVLLGLLILIFYCSAKLAMDLIKYRRRIPGLIELYDSKNQKIATALIVLLLVLFGLLVVDGIHSLLIAR